MPSGPQLIPSAQRDAITAAAHRCAPGFEHLGMLTYEGRGMDPARWADAVLLRHLLPAFHAASAAARNTGLRELKDLDAQLDQALAGPLAARSRTAGRMLATSFTAPAGERLLTRYREAILEESTPGHHAVVVAVRAAVFSVPTPSAVAALIFMELRSAGEAFAWEQMETILPLTAAADRQLRAA